MHSALSAHQRHLLTALDIELSMTDLCLHYFCSAMHHIINAYDAGMHLRQDM